MNKKKVEAEQDHITGGKLCYKGDIELPPNCVLIQLPPIDELDPNVTIPRYISSGHLDLEDRKTLRKLHLSMIKNETPLKNGRPVVKSLDVIRYLLQATERGLKNT